MIEDRNFDGIALKFAKNIYDTDKGRIRQFIIWQDLQLALNAIYSNAIYSNTISPNTVFSEATNSKLKPLHILDAGGGLAQLSQKLAKLGHQISLCDLSLEMLQQAKIDIAQNGLSDRYQFINAPVQSIANYLSEQVDVVLFHAVMEWLAEPKLALDIVLEQVKPGGVASILFYNYHGLVFKNAICGNIPHILDGMPHRKRFKLQPLHAFKPEEVYQWIEEAGFKIAGSSGIRSFHDYLGKDNLGEFQFDELLELEQQFCRQEPYRSLARYIHVWAVKTK